MDGLFERWAVEDGQRDEGESSAVVCGGAYQTQTLAVDHRAARGDNSIATERGSERDRARRRRRAGQVLGWWSQGEVKLDSRGNEAQRGV